MKHAGKRWLFGLMLCCAIPICVCAVQPASVRAGEAEEVTSGYDKGFFFDNGEQKLKIYGYMHTRWTAGFKDESLDANEFRVRRGRLLLKGNMARDLEFKTQLDFTASKPLLDYFVDYRPSTAFRLRAGQYKTPLSRQFLCSAAQKQFVDDVITTGEFKEGRDIGLMAHGEFAEGKVEYQVGVFNGSGKNARQDNTDFMYVARLALNPLGRIKITESDVRSTPKPLLSIGVSTAYDTMPLGADSEDDPGAVDLNRWTLGGELAFRWAGFNATSELFWRVDDRAGVPAGLEAADVAAMGAYLQAGYFVIPSQLEVAARAALVRPDADLDDDDLMELGPALGWFFQGHRLKLQADYAALIDEQPGADAATDHRVRLQLQASF